MAPLQSSSSARLPLAQRLLAVLQQVRSIDLHCPTELQRFSSNTTSTSLSTIFSALGTALSSAPHNREAFTISEVYKICTSLPDFGGLGIPENDAAESMGLTLAQESEIVFLTSAWLEALNSADRAKTPAKPLWSRPANRRGMTISEKILAQHDIDRRGSVKPGDVVRVDIDWVIASEASWKGMEETYELIGKPGIFRNDRFWLAGDHIVEPRMNDVPMVRKLIEGAERAKNDFKMTEYQGLNYTIMHTEFFRERAQPGMLVVGSDSHTCSAGAVSALSIGLGAADVIMPLVTGETWFKVPETINIRFVGKPPPGVGGKDTILYVLNQFKRNTIAAERFVEYTGPGLQYLSCDARFAICNMTTEFGGVTGIFEADAQTFKHVNRRGPKRYKTSSNYFRADPDAQYAQTFEVDLSKVESSVAIFPNPDDVRPVSEIAGLRLDGCFIGACTTAEEDLILAAMVLEQGLERGQTPCKGKRLMIPGSKPIRHKLDALGLTEVFQKAGFEVGIPGCSMCVGHGADQAQKGEVWLSSQNRNFKNRMGPGSIANLASAATVAASSFDMKVADPRTLLDSIDQDQLRRYLGYNPLLEDVLPTAGKVDYVEPCEGFNNETPPATPTSAEPTQNNSGIQRHTTSDAATQRLIDGKVLRMSDYIDTDAIAPAQFLIHCKTNEEIGLHCMEYAWPEFRQIVKDGMNVIVAGHAFGCGSSREQAVSALLGAGVQCVIAKSFAFIYARNQPNLGLLGITITDERFYDKAQHGVDIHVDLARRTVNIDGGSFPFELSEMEEALIAAGGISNAFNLFGKRVFQALCSKKSSRVTGVLDGVVQSKALEIF